MRIADWEGDGLVVVHDQLGDLGGAERVVETVLTRFPAAELIAPRFTTTNRAPASGDRPFERRAHVAWHGGRRRHFLGGVYARRIARVPIRDAKLVLSLTGSGWSLAATAPLGAPYLAYVTGLPRWLYGYSGCYIAEYPPAVRPLLWSALPLLRADFGRLLRRPRRVLTSSASSARDLARFHGVASDVVYPPVRTEFFTPAARPRTHLLTVARLVRHKGVDAVLAAARQVDRELIVVGGGPDLERLRQVAPANVTFAGWVEDDALRELYRGAVALLHPCVEHFGIAIAEAQACGVPVIAPRSGGASEIVRDGKTGILLDGRAPTAFAEAMSAIEAAWFTPAACRAAALRFDEARFVAGLEAAFAEELARTSRSQTAVPVLM